MFVKILSLGEIYPGTWPDSHDMENAIKTRKSPKSHNQYSLS